MTRATLIDASRISIRAALAAGLSVWIAQLLKFQYPLYALIAAVIVTDVSAAKTRQLALPRLVGTVCGAVLGALCLLLLNASAFGIGCSVLAAMFLSHALRFPEAAKLAGYVCGIVVLQHSGDAWWYAVHRVTETGLGIGLAVLVSLVPKLVVLEDVK